MASVSAPFKASSCACPGDEALPSPVPEPSRTIIVSAARTHRFGIALQVVGRADPTGTERDNLALSRRRASAVRDRLIALGVAATQLTVDATGSNDPLPADSPAEHARLNRSASFTVQARPAAPTTGSERER